MRILADVVIGRHVLDGFTITGLLLGVLGSLYLAYEFLDRKHKVLQWMTRFLAFGLLGTGCYLMFYVIIYLGASLLTPGFTSNGAIIAASVGGVVPGIIISASSTTSLKEKPRRFVWRKLVEAWGSVFLFAVVIVLIGLWVGWWFWYLYPYVIIGGISSGLIGGILAGFSAAVEWWTEHLPERRLGVIGIFLILFGFVLAMAPPLADLLDLPVH